MKNFFGVCNATFRNDLNDRAFLYGGVGAGIVRRTAECEVCARGTVVVTGNPFEEKHKDNVKKWQFLGQAFTGFGVYLNDNWQLTVGYRLRWMPGSLEQEGVRVKQDILHAAEVGLTYRF
jgi:opacity protein-like surface antigen